MPYTYLDHTADAGIEATGSTLAEAFAAAAEGLAAWLCEPDGVREVERVELRVEAPDEESLLVDFLSEVNYRFEVHRFAFRRFEVSALEERALEAVGFGEPFDEGRHTAGPQVKAVTYHGLEIVQSADGCRVRVILDI